jgi:hypothetical protein
MSTIGRPSTYHPDLCEQAHNYCLLGATNDELAEFFGVSPRTIDSWIATIPEFAEAVRKGKASADARAARALFDRAIGYERKVKRTALYRGQEKSVTNTVYYPPDTQACIFWLRNRRRRSWRDQPPEPDTSVDDIALLDAAGESVRHHDGD